LGDRSDALVIAHRGDWLEGDHRGPQNSVTAVLEALLAGADGAEVDVRLSADGTAFLHHDPDIGPADLDAGCTLPLGTPLGQARDGDLVHLSTLDQVLDAFGNWLGGARSRSVLLNIELKDLRGEPGWDGGRALAGEVARVLAPRRLTSWPAGGAPAARAAGAAGSATTKSGLGPTQVIVSCFDPAVLGHVRQVAPSLSTALLISGEDDWRSQLATYGGTVTCVNPDESLAGPELFAAANELGLAVLPWTVDDADRALYLASLGAAGLITNRPRALANALRGSSPRGKLL
jgi:glycerophosphoryl diester phosphodiesterase